MIVLKVFGELRREGGAACERNGIAGGAFGKQGIFNHLMSKLREGGSEVFPTPIANDTRAGARLLGLPACGFLDRHARLCK